MIIGRTNLDAESLNFAEGNFSKKKYYKISNAVRDFILTNSINSLPVDLFEIARKNNWVLIPYSNLRELNIAELNAIADESLGFAEYSNDDEYYIFFDDSRDIAIQRFTIAHEIGHIALKHFDFHDLCKEQEANMFAARLLMPMCVLKECNIKSPEEIQTLCLVSKLSAVYRFERLKVIMTRNKFYTDYNELKIKTQFKGFINNLKSKT